MSRHAIVWRSAYRALEKFGRVTYKKEDTGVWRAMFVVNTWPGTTHKQKFVVVAPSVQHVTVLLYHTVLNELTNAEREAFEGLRQSLSLSARIRALLEL